MKRIHKILHHMNGSKLNWKINIIIKNISYKKTTQLKIQTNQY